MARDNNTLSSMIRMMWDSPKQLHVKTRKDPLTASYPHVSFHAQTTLEDLDKNFSTIYHTNGFANRFLFACVHRTRLIASPEPLDQKLMQKFQIDLKKAIQFARRVDEIKRTADAKKYWDKELYFELEKTRVGPSAPILARGAAHNTRLQMIYALLDHSSVITRQHIDAAYATWRFSEASVKHIFGVDATDEDPKLTQLLDGLRKAGKRGMSREEIRSQIFQRNFDSDQIREWLAILLDRGLIRSEVVHTDGRPKEMFYSI
jgi:hypothetical protein